MNKKGFVFICFVIIAFLSLTGCKKECTHEWDNGTVITPASCLEQGLVKYTCLECGETEERLSQLGEHSYSSDCDIQCNVCNTGRSVSVSHQLVSTSCTEAGVCQLCNAEVPAAEGHKWNEATLLEAKKCSVCSATEGKSLLEEAFPETINQQLVVPETIGGYDLTWTSTDHEVILDDGTIIYNESPREATLNVVLSNGSEIIEKDITITVNTPSINPLEYKSVFGTYSGVLDKVLHDDANLLKRKISGFSPIYRSADENIITSDGIITKTTETQYTEMYIYIVKNGIAVMYTVEVTVSDYSSLERVNLAVESLNSLIEDYKAGKVNTLPVYDEVYDVELDWQSDIPDLLVFSDRIVLPIDRQTAYLSCTLSRETIISPEKTEVDSETVKYKLENIGGTDPEEYYDAWLETIVPTSITAHKNIVYDQYGTGELFLKNQYAVNTGAVLNLIDGQSLTIINDYFVDTKKSGLVSHWSSSTHPAISTDPSNTNLQAVYEHFYEGYTIPNADNILWIVVHESGMPNDGNNAELLAKIQYDRAYGTRASAEASWHYQVDETGIYQSYDDKVYAWHAGGDYGKWLPYRNQNSIGIEMCINGDGNYDGAMAHDAKLVAELMHRHNLNMSNVVRHHDTSGKECPSYMIRTNRYGEFLQKVRNEYIAMKYLKNAQVEWTISNPALFNKGPNGLYYAKSVQTKTNVDITLNVTIGSYSFSKTVTITLSPDGVSNA